MHVIYVMLGFIFNRIGCLHNNTVSIIGLWNNFCNKTEFIRSFFSFNALFLLEATSLAVMPVLVDNTEGHQ